MNRLTIVAIALHAFVFALLIPALEVNSSHLTNPAWPSHARLHEAWQLLTNAAIALLALRLAFSRQNALLAIALCLITGVSFLVAWVTADVYGGSMLHSDGTQMALGGINVAVLIVAGLTALLLASAFREQSN